MPNRAFIGIGSNLGDRKANFLDALQQISRIKDTRLLKQSSLYESEPHGDAKTWFVNAVVEVETALLPEALLKKLLEIETAMGRKRVSGKRWGSRIIDLDLILYNNQIIDKKNLTIPHPEMTNRRFVLIPLSELAPQFIHPKLGKTVSELLISVNDPRKIHLLRS